MDAQVILAFLGLAATNLTAIFVSYSKTQSNIAVLQNDVQWLKDRQKAVDEIQARKTN